MCFDHSIPLFIFAICVDHCHSHSLIRLVMGRGDVQGGKYPWLCLKSQETLLVLFMLVIVADCMKVFHGLPLTYAGDIPLLVEDIKALLKLLVNTSVRCFWWSPSSAEYFLSCQTFNAQQKKKIVYVLLLYLCKLSGEYECVQRK